MKTFQYLLLKTTICVITLFCLQQSTFSFDLESLSPEERMQMKQLEKELMEASTAIEEAVAQMSPKEQEEFNRAVEEMTKVLEDMPEEDFDEFLNDLFSSEFDEDMFKDMFDKEEPEVEIEEDVKPKIEVSLDEFKDIIDILDSIAKQLNALLVKISSSPDLPNKLVRWRSQNKIKHWSNEISWQSLRMKIENLATIIARMKEVDEKTKKAKYLSFIKEDKALIDNLTEFNTKLISTIPHIEVPEFGIEKLTPKAKKLTQQAATAITENLFVTGIVESLKQVEEKFEPVAKKLAQEEEAAQKKAESQIAKGPRPRPTIVAGKEETGYAISGKPQYTTSTGGIYRPTGPSYLPTATQRTSQFPGQPSATKKPSGPAGVQPEKKDDKDTKTPTGRRPDEKKLSEEEKLAKKQVDVKAEQILENVVDIVSQISEIIQQNKTLQTIYKYIFAKPKKNEQLEAIREIQQINELIKQAIGKLKDLQRRIKTLSASVQKRYQDKLQKETGNDFKIIEKLVRDIAKIAYEKNKNKIDENKRLIFFVDKELMAQAKEESKDNKEALEQIEKMEKELTSLLDVQKYITVMLNKIIDLSYEIKEDDKEVKLIEEKKEKKEKEKEKEKEKSQPMIEEEEKTEEPKKPYSWWNPFRFLN